MTTKGKIMKTICQQCKGTGLVTFKTQDWTGASSTLVESVGPCMQLACENGIVDQEEYYSASLLNVLNNLTK